MKKRTLLTCCVLAGALSLSGTAHASEISDQNMIENSGQSQNSSPDAESANTSQNTGSKNEASSTEKEIIAGTNMYEAGEMPLNTNVPGHIKGDYRDTTSAWYSFTTGSTAETEYTVVCTNTSPGTCSLDFVLYDDLGAELAQNQAENNGVPSTIVSSELTPDTTYYIQVSLNLWDDIDFILSVKDSTSESAENTKVKAVAE